LGTAEGAAAVGARPRIPIAAGHRAAPVRVMGAVHPIALLRSHIAPEAPLRPAAPAVHPLGAEVAALAPGLRAILAFEPVAALAHRLAPFAEPLPQHRPARASLAAVHLGAPLARHRLALAGAIPLFSVHARLRQRRR